MAPVGRDALPVRPTCCVELVLRRKGAGFASRTGVDALELLSEGHDPQCRSLHILHFGASIPGLWDDFRTIARLFLLRLRLCDQHRKGFDALSVRHVLCLDWPSVGA